MEYSAKTCSTIAMTWTIQQRPVVPQQWPIPHSRLDAIITPSRSRFWYMLPEQQFKGMSSAFQNMLSFENSFGWRQMRIRWVEWMSPTISIDERSTWGVKETIRKSLLGQVHKVTIQDRLLGFPKRAYLSKSIAMAANGKALKVALMSKRFWFDLGCLFPKQIIILPNKWGIFRFFPTIGTDSTLSSWCDHYSITKSILVHAPRATIQGHVLGFPKHA